MIYYLFYTLDVCICRMLLSHHILSQCWHGHPFPLVHMFSFSECACLCQHMSSSRGRSWNQLHQFNRGLNRFIRFQVFGSNRMIRLNWLTCSTTSQHLDSFKTTLTHVSCPCSSFEQVLTWALKQPGAFSHKLLAIFWKVAMRKMTHVFLMMTN